MNLEKLTKKQLIELLQQQTKVEEEVNEEVSEVKHWTKRDLYKIKDEVIEVENLSSGVVVFRSPKTKTKYKWHRKGDIEYLSIEEVMLMDNKPLFLRTPILRVLDERVCEGLGLDYSIIDEISNVEEFIEKDMDYIGRVVKQLNEDYLMELKSDVINVIKNSNLSYSKVEDLMELFKINRLDLGDR